MLIDQYIDIGNIGSAAIGIAATFITQRLLNRRGVFSYTVTHNRIGISTDDSVFGSVAITFNGEKFQNLYLSTIELKNESLNDYENIVFSAYSGDTKLMTEQAQATETLDTIHWSSAYDKKLQVISENGPSPDQLKLFYERREYFVPVFNRGQTIKITYLNSAYLASIPNIWLSASIKGVRLKFRSDEKRVIGIPKIDATLIGVTVGVIVLLLLMRADFAAPIAAAIAMIYGISTQFVGAYLTKAWQWLRNVLGG